VTEEGGQNWSKKCDIHGRLRPLLGGPSLRAKNGPPQMRRLVLNPLEL